MISERDIEAKCEYAFEEGLAKGEAKGEAKGRAEGEAKGRAEGEAKGRKEGREQERLSLISKLLQSGMTAEDIANTTGLPLETVLSCRS